MVNLVGSSMLCDQSDKVIYRILQFIQISILVNGSGLVNDTSISPGQTRTIFIAASEKETAVLTPILISYCLNGNLSYYHIVWD
jgi:hypothetical protein